MQELSVGLNCTYSETIQFQYVFMTRPCVHTICRRLSVPRDFRIISSLRPSPTLQPSMNTLLDCTSLVGGSACHVFVPIDMRG